MTKKQTFISILLLFCSSQFYPSASYAQTSPDYSTNVVIPRHVQVGTQIYEGNLSGLEDYHSNLESSNAALARSLKPDLEALQSKRTVSYVFLGVALVGLAAELSSLAFTPRFDSTTGTTKSSPMFYPLLIGGGAIAAGGLIGYFVAAPGKRDLLKFINKHNQLNPGNPLKLQLGFGPSPDLKGFGGALAFRF